MTSATIPLAPPLPWRRSIAWLLFLGPFFFLSYGFANHLAAERAVVDSLFYDWERHIPFLPWTILPYWSIDLLYGLSFLCCRDARAVDRHALRLLSAQLLAVACFLAFPLRFAFERPTSDGLFGALFDALRSFDQPYNQAPSLHIALLILIWIQFARLPGGPILRLVIHGWALLIGISVLTTWQHHFIDVPTGAALGLFCLWLWPEAGTSPFAAANPIQAPRRRLAVLYGVGAALVGTSIAFIDSAALWLGWLAIALALVGWNYAWCDAAGFQKQAGRHSLGAALLLAPYTLSAWLNSRWWTRRRPAPDCIVDDVWQGRLPTSAEMKAGGFTALCDLTAELPAPFGPWRYVCHPWLDLVAPTAEQLLAAARSIETLHGRGPVLVACALGYSRSAGAVASWLHLTGRTESMAAALALLSERHPAVVVTPGLRAVLAEVESLIAQGGSHA
ncbi:phosphatase PAP2/dual specificity phosphatase family protein [Dechloromonas sp. ARDL1]|uniref:phosphatase PAP2/dual specificity phosphatase family protein n=1 Tax=Dechloromonas sp. ARDL1 TaxID=3322121 RepID=UPI003DA70609